MQKQILGYINKHYLPTMSNRKVDNTRKALISMLQKWILSIDNKGFAGGVLMDLTKTFDTINHQVLLAKLHGFSKQQTGFSYNIQLLVKPKTKEKNK